MIKISFLIIFLVLTSLAVIGKAYKPITFQLVNLKPVFKNKILGLIRKLFLKLNFKNNKNLLDFFLELTIYSTVLKCLYNIYIQSIITFEQTVIVLIICLSVSILKVVLSTEQNFTLDINNQNQITFLIFFLLVTSKYIPLDNRKLDILISICSISLILFLIHKFYDQLKKWHIGTLQKISEYLSVLVVVELLYSKNLLSLDLINPVLSFLILFLYILITPYMSGLKPKKLLKKVNNIYLLKIVLFITGMRYLLWKI